jgi:hypothetical protein
MQTKLILFEGNPFTGKSTLSEYIAQQLALNGHAVEWVHEGAMWERFPQVSAMDGTQPFSGEVVWDEWSGFAQAVENQPAIFVVDSAVSNAAVYTLLLNDQPDTAIQELVNQLAELCAPLQPHVIYLRGDQDRLARASIADRGPKWEKQMIDQSDAAPYQRARGRSGLDAAITFLEEMQDLMDVLLEKGGWPTLILDVTANDRETNRRAVLDFLGIPEVPVTPMALAEALPVYAGTYAQRDAKGTIGSIEVRIEHDQLVLYTRGGDRLSPFVPVSANRLHLQANPIDVEFEVADGWAQRLVLFWTNGRTVAFDRT